MEYKDYYKILGVAKNASEKDIRQAYRKLARQLHPDLKPGDKVAEQRFKDVNEAYEVVGDAEKRKKYDELGTNWKSYEQWQRAGGGKDGQPFPFDFGSFAGARGGGRGQQYRTVTADELREMFGGAGGESPFSDFFETFFGGGGAPGMGGFGRTGGGRRAAATPRQGQDMEHPVDVTVEEAAQGTSRLLHLTDPRTGAVRRLEVKIPAGVTEGSRVRMAGQGGPGTSGGSSGDLYLVVHLTSGGQFAAEGNNLRVQVSVPLATAMLGGEVEVPTPRGSRLALRIPEATQDGRVFRLRGQGLPGPTGEKGDILAEVHVALPQTLTPRHRELFEELARLEEPAAAGSR